MDTALATARGNDEEKMLEVNPYSLEINQRRRMLADAGFARSDQRIWIHPDERAIGEAVASALSDTAFCRFLQIELPVTEKTE